MRLLDRHREAGEAAGAQGFCHVMQNHVALFFDRGPARLVVTFDNLVSINDPAPQYPWAYGFVQAMGASHLGVMMAGEPDWFRHADVLDFFDRLCADGFFAGFNEVVFYGSSMGGYGALTFARCAPGCRVVAFVPQTQLDPAVVPFERRYRAEYARGDWSGRYLDGVEGARAAARVFVLYDPYFPADARHVARFEEGTVVPLRLPWSTHHSGPVLRRTGHMKDVLNAAFDGDLTAEAFRRTVRDAGRSGMGARLVLRAGLDRGHARLVAQALDWLEEGHPHLSFPVLRHRARQGG